LFSNRNNAAPACFRFAVPVTEYRLPITEYRIPNTEYHYLTPFVSWYYYLRLCITNGAPFMANPHLIALDTVGQIETYVSDLTDIENRLSRIPLWQPATILSRQAAEARRMIHGLHARLDGRLVVTLIGPSGAGKSTIFNALSGSDHLSATGIDRPTTRDLVVLSNDAQAARQLLGPVDEDKISIHAGPAAKDLDHLILVDTPDTDSTHSPGHLDLLHRIVSRSDVLLCVFDAQNPKRRDHADFMAPLVKRFNGGSLVAVVNKCDRHSPEELSEIIGPDFDAYLQKAWQTRPEAMLLVSARRHLKDPQWDPQTQPRHDLDQFDKLHQLVTGTMNRPGAGRDRRIANAGQIRDYVIQQTHDAVNRQKAHLIDAAEKMSAAEGQGLKTAIALLRADDRRRILGVNVRLYQALAQRWLGPVGWLVAIWSRLIVFGSGLAALVSFGNPLRQLWSVVSSWKKFKESRSALEMLNDSDRVDTALHSFRRTLVTLWPDIAEVLIKGGFHPDIRAFDSLTAENNEVEQALDRLWSDALDRHINGYAKGLSHILLQLLFNLPAVALLGYVGWLTASGFFSGQYLSSDFFLHALLTIAIVLLLSFFLLQALVRLVVGKDRIQRRAFNTLEKEIAQRPLVATRKIADQVKRVLNLVE
jgi:energy-coupling factor transporter ATP-binding protein EcfA2